jgi:hypothetical protein
MQYGRGLTIIFGIFVAFLLPAWGLSRKSIESSSSPFAKAVVKKFGMAIGGQISIEYSVYPQNPSVESDGYVLILVTTETEREGFYSDIGESTVTNPNSVANLCMQPSMARIFASNSGSFNMTIADNFESEQYSILLLQCRSGSATNPLQISVTINMKNPHPTDSSFTHLAIEDVNLLRIFGGEGILYMLFLLLIAGQFIFYR